MCEATFLASGSDLHGLVTGFLLVPSGLIRSGAADNGESETVVISADKTTGHRNFGTSFTLSRHHGTRSLTAITLVGEVNTVVSPAPDKTLKVVEVIIRDRRRTERSADPAGTDRKRGTSERRNLKRSGLWNCEARHTGTITLRTISRHGLQARC